MANIELVVALFSIVFKIANGQNVINGDPYFCVPPGTCLGGIDPRIMTPVAEELRDNESAFCDDEDADPPEPVETCPAGMVPCQAQGAKSSCGVGGPKTIKDGYSDVGAFPWQAYLMGPTGAFIGSGSLLSPYHVLTASHKVLGYAPGDVTVVMGVNTPPPASLPPPATLQSSKAKEITIYNATTYAGAPIYDNTTLKNDIAIITLATPIKLLDLTKVNTICLPPASANNNTYVSQRCVVSGWGQYQPVNTPPAPTPMKRVYVNTTTMEECKRGFAGKVDTTRYLDDQGGQICAGGEDRKDACFQDGGAPLSCGAGTDASRFTVAGIVIWGKSCGQPGVYGVYTNVPFYRNFIISTITKPIT